MLRRVALPLLLFSTFFAYGQIPAITNVSPEIGPVGAEVTITGINFSNDPSALLVRFGNVRATVLQATPQQIRVRVPAGADHRPISVLVNSLLATSPKPFSVTSFNETLINASSFSEATTFEVSAAPYEVATADLDVDGKTDAIIVGLRNITVLRNTTVPGRFAPASFSRVDLFTEGLSINSVAIADMDGDGKQDVVVVGAVGNTNSVTVFRNNCLPGAIGEASFNRSTFAMGPGPTKITAADLDLDGKPDLITANSNNSISILKNISGKDGIAFENQITINAATPGSSKTVTVADLDGDGKPEIVAYNFSNNVYTVTVSRNQSVPSDIRSSSFALPVSFGSGVSSESDIVIGDLDNDGKPEMLANYGGNSISVLKNTSTQGSFTAASFATKVDFGTGASPLCGKVITELNGDGFPDAISTNRESNTVSLFQNKGQQGVINTATFLPKVDLATGQKPTGVASADFDGDGMIDIIVVSRDSRTASVYRNQMADPVPQSFTPSNGAPQTSVTISGVNFGIDAAALTVRVSGILSTVTAVTNTSIVATIPSGAVTGTISVARKGVSNASASEFTVLPVSISSLTPPVVSIGDVVTIRGSGFSLGWNNNVIRVNGVEARIVSCNANEIKVIVPVATTGKVSVSTNGVAASSTADLRITTASITEVTFPELFTVGEPSATARIRVANPSAISRLRFLTKGITEGGATYRTDNLEVTPSGSTEFAIPASYFSDPIGIQGKFVITDLEGYELERVAFIYKRFEEGPGAAQIPSLSFGTDPSNYHIIAIPLDLAKASASSVFRDLGDPDPRRWRAYTYENQRTEEIKLGNESIHAGYGYWLIVRDEAVINPGIGTTVRATADNPFVLRLLPGWNLIGNPYDFNISWANVLAYNKNPVNVGSLNKFSEGVFYSSDELERFRGAFVRNAGSEIIYLKVPVTGSSGAGRIGHNSDPDNWEISLTLSNGSMTNSLGGFGMNKGASETIDRWDEMTLPVPASLRPFELSMGNGLVKSITPPSPHYTWNAMVTGSEELSLSWDRENVATLNGEVWLEIEGQPGLIDMRIANEIRLSPGTTELRIFYGPRSYVAENGYATREIIGEVAVNPLPKTTGKITIPVNFPQGTQVAIHMMDSKGAGSREHFEGTFSKGRHTIEWLYETGSLASGMYFIHVLTNDGVTARSYVRKLLIE